jgi:uncharacterized membrane protein required for colicin V production
MHWQGARPAAVFWVLRFIVAALAGLAVASLFQWVGDMLYGAVKKSLVGWLDRAGGFFLGAAIGAAIAGLALIAMLALPWPKSAAGLAAQARFTPVVIRSGRWVLDRSDRYVPGGDGLRIMLRDAERRLRHAAQHS